jgi:hypothetical protein
MLRCISLLTAVGVMAALPSPAQTPAPLVCQSVRDVKTFVQTWNDAVIGLGSRSHACMLAMLTPDARITGVVIGKDGKSSPVIESPKEFVGWYEQRPNETFWERTLHSTVEVYENVARITRTYEVRSSPTGPVTATGIEDFQLVRERAAGDGSEWKVFAMLWQDATPGKPLPQRYLPDSRQP